MIRGLWDKVSRGGETETVAKGKLTVDLAHLGRLDAGGEVPAKQLGAVTSMAAWTTGATLNSLVPAITLHYSKGVLTSVEGLTLVTAQLLLTTCFTVQAARCANGLNRGVVRFRQDLPRDVTDRGSAMPKQQIDLRQRRRLLGRLQK
jgi:hypothetical protein